MKSIISYYDNNAIDVLDVMEKMRLSQLGVHTDYVDSALFEQAVQFAFALCSFSYSFHLDPFENNGWTDFSIISSGEIMGGDQLNEGKKGAISGLFSDVKQLWASKKAKNFNIFSQVKDFRQSKEEKETLRAVLMGKEENEKYVISIGFSGTSKRLYEWVDNFKMSVHDGLHQGFYELNKELMHLLPDISFPTLAKKMGRPSLTMQDVVNEMKKDDCPFRLVCAGHSRGGAIMQIFFYTLLKEGVLPKYIGGIGFASPSVAQYALCAPSPFPLLHVQHADDLTSRVGCEKHFGQELIYKSTVEEKKLFYKESIDEPIFRHMLLLMHQSRNTSDMLLLTIAYFQALIELDAEGLGALVDSPLRHIFPDSWIQKLDQKLDGLLKNLQKHFINAYYDIEEKPFRYNVKFDFFLAMHRKAHKEYGALPYMSAFNNAFLSPHKLNYTTGNTQNIAPYFYIVQNRLNRLIPPTTQRVKRSVSSNRFALLSAEKNRRNRRKATH